MVLGQLKDLVWKELLWAKERGGTRQRFSAFAANRCQCCDAIHGRVLDSPLMPHLRL